MEKIMFKGRSYDADVIASYYDTDVIAEMNCYTLDPQEFFDEYIKADPEFVDLFEYDFTPID